MFEGFKRKITATVYEAVETKKAEESMTEEQARQSAEREHLTNLLQNAGIEVGDDLNIEKIKASEEGPRYMYTVRGTLNGKRVRFWFDATENPIPSINVTNLRCAIDGQPVTEEDAHAILAETWDVIKSAHWLIKNDMGPIHDIP